MLYEGYKLTLGTDYTWDGKYYTTEACTTVATGTISTLDAGTYYVQVEGTGVYKGKRAASFEVEKAEVSVGLVTSLTKYYGAADPELTDANIDWSSASGFVGSDDKSVFTGTLTYTHSGVNASTTPYPVTVSGYTAKNYTLTITGGITINPKPITAEMITAVELSEIYKGAAFDEFAVIVKDGTTPLVAGTDFDVKAYEEAGMTTEATPISVKKYYLAIENKASANYKLTTHLAAGTFEITKAGLTVMALDQEKVYDGATTLPSIALGTAYKINGVKGTDTFTAFTTSNFTITGDANVKGDVIVTPKDLAGANVANYDINYVSAKLTIKKKELKLTALDFQKTYGQADADATGYRATGYVAGDAATATGLGYGGVKIEGAVGTEWQLMAKTYATTSADTKTYGTLAVERSNADKNDKGEYAGVLEVKYNESGSVWANYKIETVAGKYTINGGKIYITALDLEKNYGDADPSWIPEEGTNYRVDGLSGSDKVTGVTLTCTHEEAVGPYTINISATGIPAGYQDVVIATGTFTINKRPIKVTAKPQSLKVGQTVAALDQTAYTIDNSTTLKDGDTAAEVFSLAFKTGIAEPLVAGSSAADGIVVKATAGKGANYDFTACVAGALTVVAADAIVLNDNADITTTAATSKDVTFASRVLKGNQWNVLVLPFKTSAKAISIALDYAVIDVFDTSASDGNVHFKLNVTAGNSDADYIAANTPFLVYPTKDINMNTVTFSGVDVVATTDNVEVSDGGGNKFIGTYKSTPIAGEKYRYMSNGTFYDAKNYTATNPATIKPLRAYLDLTGSDAAAPVIFIDEPDGTVTAIETVARDSESLNTEGAWYKLNGMKIEGKPTEKGVYIKNGKKVVIK